MKIDCNKERLHNVQYAVTTLGQVDREPFPILQRPRYRVQPTSPETQFLLIEGRTYLKWNFHSPDCMHYLRSCKTAPGSHTRTQAGPQSRQRYECSKIHPSKPVRFQPKVTKIVQKILMSPS